MEIRYTLFSWQLSYFSGKTRGYLNFKNVPYKDKNINAIDLFYRIPSNTGARVMPVIKTNSGEWLQDTSLIMDELDKRHPESTVLPETPKQAIASMLLEAWLDEYWVPIGMHYRWSYPENHQLFIDEASSGLLPYVPNFVRRPVATKVSLTLQNILPLVGVRPEQFEMIERWTNKILDLLEAHFSQYTFLFGDKPSTADFALLGPLYGHLNYDPAPKRDLLDVRPKLQNWVERCHAGEGRNGQYLESDEIPNMLMPVLKAIGEEFIPMVNGIVKNIECYVEKNNTQSGTKLSRAIGETRFKMDGEYFTRGAFPYTVWMMQRIQDHFCCMSISDQKIIDDFTSLIMDEPIGKLKLGPKLERVAVGTRLA